MSRYIDADLYIEYLNELRWSLIKHSKYKESNDLKFEISRIKNFPTTEVQKIRHGKWEKEIFQGEEMSLCSECRNVAIETDYCPYCGANMDEE